MANVLSGDDMNLAAMIKKSGMSHAELARRSGLSRGGLYLWLQRAAGDGKASTAQRVAAALGVTVEELLKAKGKR